MRLLHSYSLILLALVFEGTCVSQTGISDLMPVSTSSLSQIIGHYPWNSFTVREMRASNSTLWFLIASKELVGRFALVSLKPTQIGIGKVEQIIVIPGEAVQAAGLAVTAKGVATVLLRKTPSGRLANFLTEFDVHGNVISQTAMQCYWAGGLITAGGRASAVCADGTITQYPDGAQIQSWIRPGSIVQVLSTGNLAIVDQARGQIVLNDISRFSLTALNTTVPEIQEAVSMVSAQTANVPVSANAAAPAGRPLVVVDTASDSSVHAHMAV